MNMGDTSSGAASSAATTVPLVPCPVLVGRSQEAQKLAALLDATRAGRGAVVFIVGEAGIGKSRLVQETQALAVASGMRILRGRAVSGSGAAPFRPLTEAFVPVVDSADLSGDLEPWLPALAGVLPTVPLADAAEASPPVRGEAILRLLGELCAGPGGLLVLEDLHWADLETIAVVEHLCDNLERAPVLCLATVRSEEETPARELARRADASRTTLVLNLSRLNEAQVAAMVFSCTGGSSADAVARIAAQAGGVPFLVEEMLVSPGLPASFAEGVAARLGALGEDVRRVLVTAAASGHHFDWRLLTAATGLTDEQVANALERGIAAQLLAVDGEEFRFRHALTAEAVFLSVIPPRRASYAAAALAALDAAHAELPGRVREVAARLAERAGQRDRAGRLHLAAGEHALARGALHTAVAALERAVELIEPGATADVARMRLVDALSTAGRVEDAFAVGEGLVARLDPASAAAVHLRLAAAAVSAARWDRAADHLASARPLVDQTGATMTELTLREADLAIGTNETARAEQLAITALHLARAEDAGELECEALQLIGRCARRSSLDAAEPWFRDALAAADRHDLPVWRLRALHEIGTIALLDRSEVDALLEAQRLAESVGAMATATVLDVEIAAGYAGLDDFDMQRRHGMQAVRRGGELGFGLIVAFGWQHVAGAARLSGDIEGANAAAAAARSAAPGNRDIEGLLLGGDMFDALADDDLDRALELAEQSTDALRGSETAPPAHFRAAWPLLLAHARRDEAAAAVDEIEQAGVDVSRAGRGWLTMTRAVLAGRSEPDRAQKIAVEADGLLECTPMWRSVARRLAAAAAAADGWEPPAEWMTEAEGCFRAHGRPAAAAACRMLRRGAPTDVPAAWVGLGITRRESDVLALVVEGCANREIADRLYLSVRTVEKHVESLLRKTGTRTRTQLARATAPT